MLYDKAMQCSGIYNQAVIGYTQSIGPQLQISPPSLSMDFAKQVFSKWPVYWKLSRYCFFSKQRLLKISVNEQVLNLRMNVCKDYWNAGNIFNVHVFNVQYFQCIKAGMGSAVNIFELHSFYKLSGQLHV